MREKQYRIIRQYESGSTRNLKRYVSVEVAVEHCAGIQASSLTATGDLAKKRTAKSGHWKDRYEEDSDEYQP